MYKLNPSIKVKEEDEYNFTQIIVIQELPYYLLKKPWQTVLYLLKNVSIKNEYHI